MRMRDRQCAANECTDTVGAKGAKGYCPVHYRRLKRYGDANYTQPTYTECQIDGCHKPPRSTHADLCAMHYHRQYRDGDTGEPGERIAKTRQPHCIIDGCTDPDVARGLCSKHDGRLRRNGDPLRLIPHSERYLRGEDHPQWRDTLIGYTSAHQRVKSLHGSAKDHSCIDCGNTAAHWSYDHTDTTNERYYEYKPGKYAAYSPDPTRYAARCVPCHKAFDLGRIDSAEHGVSA